MADAAAALNCAGGILTAPAFWEQLQSEAAVLTKASDAGGKGLVLLVTRFLLAPSDVDVVAQASAMAAECGLNGKEVKAVIRFLLEVLNGAIKHGCSPMELAADLRALGCSEAACATLGDAWETKGSDLAHRAASSAVMVNRLVDMSWTFGVSVATNEVAPVGETFLQLRLVLATGGGGRDNVYMELTLPQFYELLGQLQRAKAILDFLASGA